MLFKQNFLNELAAGAVDTTFRRWQRARVKQGSLLRTAVGLVEVLRVDVVPSEKITTREARRAGLANRADLIGELDRYGDGPIHRVRLKLVGPDPRVALREQAKFDKSELAELVKRLKRMDTAATQAWTREMLILLKDRAGERAGDLAASFGQETLHFKRNVRKLKELGLTESLEVGYRLSPRGRALLRRWKA